MVEDTQKRYADDITVRELVRLRTENERLQEALKKIADAIQSDWFSMRKIARAALNGDKQ
jgi:hypothetical protein